MLILHARILVVWAYNSPFSYCYLRNILFYRINAIVKIFLKPKSKYRVVFIRPSMHDPVQVLCMCLHAVQKVSDENCFDQKRHL